MHEILVRNFSNNNGESAEFGMLFSIYSGIRKIYLKIVPVHIVPSQIVQKKSGRNLAMPLVRLEEMSFRISLASTVHSR
jgi:hypothetical protein